ncbi:hypothetical protein BN2476_120018 [Paraburkholderia piptadeniae]|uniref:Uncharacterized protein n=1 Tax=Paraburkholderia piptadeniae TaxID=1701573 RepID=A0A1N7RR43_9BURK|nr:hypothetical protein BN2476_120018 [Paraburkholderia piptadeniae]
MAAVRARPDGPLAAYALAVLRALFAWLVGHHYVIINAFARRRGARRHIEFLSVRARQVCGPC